MVILRCYLFVTGGRNGVEWVASLLWNQWPEWSRMGGRNAVEYAPRSILFKQLRYHRDIKTSNHMMRLAPDSISIVTKE